MTVSISRFFRDSKVWEVLEAQILPDLIKSERNELQVWIAGCASGEEVYSLKILWESLISTSERSPELVITATDMNPVYLERAGAGIYQASSLKEVPEKVRSVYFIKKAGGKSYMIKDSLKSGISWQVGNLLYDTPESQFHIIFLRNNLLTYYKDNIIQTALKKIIASLSSGGFLIIGSHESLPFEIKEINQYGSFSYIFKKQD
jgi:chemotaxis methyl-accepting protein methylase